MCATYLSTRWSRKTPHISIGHLGKVIKYFDGSVSAWLDQQSKQMQNRDSVLQLEPDHAIAQNNQCVGVSQLLPSGFLHNRTPHCDRCNWRGFGNFPSLLTGVLMRRKLLSPEPTVISWCICATPLLPDRCWWQTSFQWRNGNGIEPLFSCYWVIHNVHILSTIHILFNAHGQVLHLISKQGSHQVKPSMNQWCQHVV